MKSSDQDQNNSMFQYNSFIDHAMDMVRVSKIPLLLTENKKGKDKLEDPLDLSLESPGSLIGQGNKIISPKKSEESKLSNKCKIQEENPNNLKTPNKFNNQKNPINSKSLSKLITRSQNKFSNVVPTSKMKFNEIPTRLNKSKSTSKPKPVDPVTLSNETSFTNLVPFTDPNTIQIPTHKRPKKLNLVNKFSTISFTDLEPPFYDATAVYSESFTKAAPKFKTPAPIPVRSSKSDSKMKIRVNEAGGSGSNTQDTRFNSHSRQNSQVSNATYTIEAYDSESTFRY